MARLVGNPRLTERSLYIFQNLTQAKQKYVGYLVSVLCIILIVFNTKQMRGQTKIRLSVKPFSSRLMGKEGCCVLGKRSSLRKESLALLVHIHYSITITIFKYSHYDFFYLMTAGS